MNYQRKEIEPLEGGCAGLEDGVANAVQLHTKLIDNPGAETPASSERTRFNGILLMRTLRSEEDTVESRVEVGTLVIAAALRKISEAHMLIVSDLCRRES